MEVEAAIAELQGKHAELQNLLAQIFIRLGGLP
jgi:hypothetical protein